MIGARLGPYTIEAELGSGAMGTVYRATGPQGRVALKILHPHLLSSPGILDRFLREVEIGRRVEHRNVVRTYDGGVAQVDGATHHFLAMEYVEGQTLRTLREELEQVPEELCRHIGLEIAKGLEAIHAAGVVHRDLKPENVLLTPDHVVKVMDLGLARVQEAALRLSQSGAFVGSALYAAPEQFEGRPVDARADYYALGLILFEAATGRHPSGGADFTAVAHRRLHDAPPAPTDLQPELSRFFAGFVQALLARDPAERPPAPRAILEEGERSAWWQDRQRRGDAAPARRRLRVARETSLFGRDDELAALAALFDRARGGDGCVAWIEGEAGVGKTRLVDEFVARIEREGAAFHFLHGAYAPGGVATAAGGFSMAYREHFGARGSRPWLEETPRLAPAFDALLRGEPVPPGEPALTADSIPTVFVHATRALARELPTVVFIDDVHNAPAEGRTLFAALAHALPGHRVLLVGATRTDPPAALPPGLAGLQHVVRVPLRRLQAAEVERLLVETRLTESVARELAPRVATRTDGNPFFILEILRSLRESGAIAGGADGAAARQAIDSAEIPASVAELLASRLAGLDAEDRDLLDVAACCGVEFDPVLVAEASGVAVVPTLKRFARIERAHRLVRSAGRRLVFDHHQIREMVYAALHEALCERYHAAIAGALERGTTGEPAGADAVDLCRHLLRGGMARRAARYLDAALHHLEAGHLHDEVVRLAREALDAGGAIEGARRVELLLRVSGRLEMLGRVEEERAVLDEALACAGELDTPLPAARVRERLGWHLCRRARHDEAETVLRQGLATARATGDRALEGRITANLGNVHWARGRYEEAKEHAELSLSLARQAGDLLGQAKATGNIGNAQRALRRGDEAQASYRRAFELFRQLGDGRGQAVAVGNLGNTFERLGRYEDARREYERHLALSREFGYRRGEAIATGNLGLVRSVTGELAAAREHFARSLQLSREIGDRVGEATTLDNLASATWTMGETAEAQRLLDESIRICEEIGERRILGYSLARAGANASALGDFDVARRLVERALDVRRELGDPGTLASTLLIRAVLRGRTEDADGARADLDEAVELARGVGDARALLLATLHRAALDPGPEAAAEAERCFAENAARVPHDVHMEAHHLMWLATGSAAHLEEARKLLDELLSGMSPEARARAVRNVPLLHAIAG